MVDRNSDSHPDRFSRINQRLCKSRFPSNFTIPYLRPFETIAAPWANSYPGLKQKANQVCNATTTPSLNEKWRVTIESSKRT